MEEVAAGAWAGLVGTVLGYPLDVVKGRMQTGKGVAGSGAKANFARTLVSIARAEGVTGMYRGLGPPVCMMMVMNSMNFGAFYHMRDKLAGANPVGWGTERPWIDWRVVCAAASVGPLCAMVSTPFELVKLQVQLDAANHSRTQLAATKPATDRNASPIGYVRKYSGSAHAARQLLKTHGPRVFFLGHGVNTARECVFNAVFFSAFEHTAHGFETEAGLSPAMATAAAGGVAGAAGWLTNLPLDCVKSGIQGQCLGDGRGGWDAGRGARVGFVEAARAVGGRGGIAGFFAGAAPSLARSFVVSGSRFTAFTGAMGAFRAVRERAGASLTESEIGRD
ncbi:mitochondrial carrier family [Micromonas commoda]|uniref:Mitochondrial carrier family n=1 Tax=Micromonas commoda (strain RCC299 / NOUM17 / CCMP2709) TaxID=296587 RepID=C1FJ79_MICCC|nr:mitochondrial carrier family [Micromonas commoda]ACO70544.1 mitochondrial carrier family [Micromonas commoda]|eukprot:XP_002509286.1 mitochondrial carrier family [Micromonas commoda]